MQNLKINPDYAGKVITKDLGYTVQRIEVDKLKPSQYERIYKMGFKEIFLTDGREEKETASDKVVEGSKGNDGVVEQVQKPTTRKRKPKVA